MNPKAALYHPHTPFLENRIFQPRDIHTDPLFHKYSALRSYLTERGIELQTYDRYEHTGDRPDVYLFINFVPSTLKYILRTRIRGGKLILWANETKANLGNSRSRRFMWRLLELLPRRFPLFSIVLSYDPDLVDGKRFRSLLMPQPFSDSYRTRWEKDKNRFSAMIFGFKQSNTTGELYSLRQTIIRYFEANHPDAFDLYGTGWNQPGSNFQTSLYRGTVTSKLDTLAQYRFTFCPENYSHPGYITEKIFDALFAGSVPIYLGAPNVTEFIPGECFVDWRKYSSLDEIYRVLLEISQSGRFQEIRECGWEFLRSDRFTPFSVSHFCQVIHRAIIDLL